MRFLPVLALILLVWQPQNDPPWTEIAGSNELKAWKTPSGEWAAVGTVHPDPSNPKLLKGEPGTGIIYNGAKGVTTNLISKDDYGDIEMKLEFMIPSGSNAGVKLHGQYEVQIFDSYGKEKPTASDSGGVYPRAELLPKYHHIDEGFPPKVNASKPPGEWQTLQVFFRSPRFDASGKKITSAKFDKVLLNDQVVQENLEVPAPTGHAYRNKEHAAGPILLQADHGPVAFRSVTVRPLPPRGDENR